MAFNPVAIATKGYVTGVDLQPIAIATDGYITQVSIPTGIGGGWTKRIKTRRTSRRRLPAVEDYYKQVEELKKLLKPIYEDDEDCILALSMIFPLFDDNLWGSG